MRWGWAGNQGLGMWRSGIRNDSSLSLLQKSSQRPSLLSLLRQTLGEDLTVLGGTSTHRTPKVRSSMELLQRLRQRYLQFLQVVVDVLEGGTHYRDFEDRLRQELDALGRDIVKWVAEACDERLREEPQARPGWVVARRGDEKQLLTPFGMVSYERTYFRHRAGKQYAYLADAIIGVTPHQRVNDGVKARLVERAVEQSYRK